MADRPLQAIPYATRTNRAVAFSWTTAGWMVWLTLVALCSAMLLNTGAERRIGLGGRDYPFTHPFLWASGVTVALCVAGLLAGRFRPVVAAVVLLSCAVQTALAWRALDHWPGGDDGSGFGWLFLVVGGSAALFFVAMVTAVILGLSSAFHHLSSQTDQGAW